MWTKIFKTSFLREFKVYCPEGMLLEDIIFSYKAYINCNKMVFISNYSGYSYSIRDLEDDFSTNNSRSINSMLKLLKGHREFCNIGKNNRLYVEWIMEEHFLLLLYHFSRLDASYTQKIEVLEEIYAIQEEFGWITPNETWAKPINRNIKKRNFKRVIFLGNIIKTLRDSKTMTKIYYEFFKKN